MTQREYKLLKDWNPKKGDVFECKSGMTVTAISDTDAVHSKWSNGNFRPFSYFIEEYTLISRATPNEPPVGEWIGWNGGECPVHPYTLVEMVAENVCKMKGAASGFYWDTRREPAGCSQVIAYRVITPYVENWTPAEEGKVYERVKVKLVDGVAHVLEVKS